MLSSINEEKIEIFYNKNRLEELMTTKPALHKTIKWILQTKGENKTPAWKNKNKPKHQQNDRN